MIVYVLYLMDFSTRYRVEGVFSTMEKAEEYALSLNRTEDTKYDRVPQRFEIVEYVVDEPDI